MNIIVAVSKNGIIGINGHLPWNIPKDVKYFHDITLNNICVMGRKSLNMFIKYEPSFLQNRINIVITSKNLQNTNNIYFTNINNVLKVINYVKNVQLELPLNQTLKQRLFLNILQKGLKKKDYIQLNV
jgi:dihydrofolate reductase